MSREGRFRIVIGDRYRESCLEKDSVVNRDDLLEKLLETFLEKLLETRLEAAITIIISAWSVLPLICKVKVIA